MNGPTLVISLARIETMVGRQDEAIARLEHSLATTGGITMNELRLDPTWDSLRAKPSISAIAREARRVFGISERTQRRPKNLVSPRVEAL